METITTEGYDDDYIEPRLGSECPICGNYTLIYVGRCGQCQNMSCGYNTCGM